VHKLIKDAYESSTNHKGHKQTPCACIIESSWLIGRERVRYKRASVHSINITISFFSLVKVYCRYQTTAQPMSFLGVRSCSSCLSDITTWRLEHFRVVTIRQIVLTQERALVSSLNEPNIYLKLLQINRNLCRQHFDKKNTRRFWNTKVRLLANRHKRDRHLIHDQYLGMFW